MPPALENTIVHAAQNHTGQVNKAGQPYILHPLRVMLMMDTEQERIATVLHDVVEKTPVMLKDLRRLGYPLESYSSEGESLLLIA